MRRAANPRAQADGVVEPPTTRRALVWVCLTIFVNQLGFGSILPVVPLYADTFGVSQTAIGLAIAVYGAARFLFNVPTARVADRLGRRWALAFGGVITVVGSLICGVADSYWLFLAGRFVAGGGASMVITGCQIITTDISVPANRGRLMAVYQGVFLFAVGIGPIPGGFLAEAYGLAAPFYGHAALAGVVTLLAWFGIPETKGFGGSASAGKPVPALPFSRQARLLTAQAGFLLIGFVSFTSFFARTGALFNLIPPLAEGRLELTPGEIGLGLGIISIVGLALAYPSGVLVDRFGRKTVIVPSTLFSGASMVLFAVMPSPVWFYGACLSWAVATGIAGAAPSAYAADMAPAGMNASAMGLYRMIADSGYVLGPLLLGLSADLLSPELSLVLTAGLVLSAGAVFGLFAPETYSARLAAARDSPPSTPGGR
jgi:MFS family permease